MGKGFLTYSTAVILQAVANGYLYGFDIIDITGLPGGTVYPALRRLEEAGYLASKWEKQSIAQAEPRPICRSSSGRSRSGPGSMLCSTPMPRTNCIAASGDADRAAASCPARSHALAERSAKPASA